VTDDVVTHRIEALQSSSSGPDARLVAANSLQTSGRQVGAEDLMTAALPSRGEMERL
jgi:hypothetical protein